MSAERSKRPGKKPPPLKTSGEVFRGIFEHSPDPIYIHDLKGNILEANRAASEVMGYSLEELKNMRVTDVDAPRDAAKVPVRITNALRKGGVIFESEHKRRDGTVFPVEVNACPVEYMDKPAVIATVRDITGRKADEERQSRLAAISENSNDAIVTLDTDATIVVWNKGAERMFGYTEKEIIGKPVTILAPDPQKPQGPGLIKAVARGKRLEHFETRRRRKDGKILDVSLTLSAIKDREGNVTGFSGALRDITEQKLAEAALRKSEETLRRILDQSPMATAIVAMDGTIEYINKKSIAIFGYLPEDIPTMDRWWVQAYPEANYRAEVTARWMNHIERAIAENREIEGGEYRVTCKDGSVKTTHIFGVVVEAKIFVMFDDITARKRTKDLLAESENKFRTLTENTTVGVYLIQDGLFKYLNPELARLFGYGPGELTEKNGPRDLVYPEDWPLVRENLRKRIAGETRSENYEFRGLKKNGEIISVEVYGAVTDYCGKPAVIGTLLDRTERRKAEEEIRRLNLKLEQRVQERTLELQAEITEHKKTEAALQDTAGKYSALFEYSGNAIMMLDTEGFFDCNTATLKLFGLTSKSDFIGIHPAKLSPPKQPDGQDSLPAAQARIAEAFKKGTADFEWTHIHSDGTTFQAEVLLTRFELGGRPVLQAVVRDISARKKAETALNERLSAMEAYPGLVSLVDMNGLHTYINPSGARMLGYRTPAEIVGTKHISDFHTPEDLKYVMETGIPAAIENGVWTAENRLLRPDGSLLPVEETIFVIKDEKGRPRNMGAIMTDLTSRKRAEREMLESRAMLESVVENTPLMIFVKDAEKLRFAMFNRAGEDLLGQDRTTLLGKNDYDFSPPEQADFFTSMDRDVLMKNEIMDIPEEPILTAKKGTRLLHTRKVCIKGADGAPKYLLGISEDITDRKAAENKLRQSEEKYRALVETTGTGFLILNSDGKVVDANNEYVRLSGHTGLNDILGRSVIEWTLESDREFNSQAIAKCLELGYIRDLCIHYMGPTGHKIPVEINATVIHTPDSFQLVSLVRDITERRRREEELRFANTLLKTQQETSTSGILVVDENRNIVSFNASFVKIWGIPQNVLDTMSDDLTLKAVLSKLVDPDKFGALVKHLYEHREEKSRDEIALKDGRILDRYSASMLGPAGEYYGRVWYFRDITESRLAEEQIKKLNTDLLRTVGEMETANKELEAFTYSVSHDLRTPLRHMMEFAKLLAEEAGDALQGQTRHYLDVVSGSARKMDRLITSLLAFSKLARAKPDVQEFSGKDLVEEVAGDIREDNADRNIEWKIGDIPALNGDRFMLKQVLINLLSNAVKYSSGKDPAHIEIFSDSKGDETVIAVRDNGIGFDMKHYDQLFGVFQRLHSDREFEGTGIGLANVKSVISKHGGRVWAESIPGRETTFYFSLPAAGSKQ